MKTTRLKQYYICNSTEPPVFANFVQSLIENMNNEHTMRFFLSWLKLYLDVETRLHLPELNTTSKIAFNLYEKSNTKENENLVFEAGQLIDRASFGLEHFLREMGQVYEAFSYCIEHGNCRFTPKSESVINCLPVVAAKLVLLGIPFEIMDGEAANVPLVWTKAVFKELSVHKRKKKIVSLSVIGIQSSGKSTLLNTIFGLQFPVSAGRCTRGVFVQLVPVHRAKSSCDFDYIMVIDTEGLRAPQLDLTNNHHDNELATFLIGMADIVILNVKGETISGDLENVLEIVSFGLLRIQQANENLSLHQSCILVHQNVSAKDAKVQTQQGNQKTVQNLNKMIKEVAAQMNITNINAFTDVIGFNPEEHILYVPDLWFGSPPMAPISTDYIDHINNVTQCVLGIKEKRFYNFEKTSEHFEIVWNAILSDDFAFSFRNCLELKAYCILETAFQEFVWNLEDFKLEWCDTHIRSNIQKCRDKDMFSTRADELKTDFKIQIYKKLSTISKDLSEFLQSSELKDKMLHWEEAKQKNLELTKDDLVYAVNTQIQDEVKYRKIEIETSQSYDSVYDDMQKKAKDFATNSRGTQPCQDEIDKKFNELWQSQLTAVGPVTNAHELNSKMIRTMKVQMHKKFEKIAHLFKNKINDDRPCEKLKYSIDKEIKKGIHFNITKSEWAKNKLKGFAEMMQYDCTSVDYEPKVKNIINNLFHEIEEYFKMLLHQSIHYNQTQFSKILKMVTKVFDTQSSCNTNNSITLKDELRVIVLLQIRRYSCTQFQGLNEKFVAAHSFSSKLAEKRDDFRQVFNDIVCNTTADIASKVICAKLKYSVQEEMVRKVTLKAQREIHQHFEMKDKLLRMIMKDLAEGETFDDFMFYVRAPEMYALLFFEKEIEKCIFKTHGVNNTSLYKTWTSTFIDETIGGICNAAKFAEKSSDLESTKKWLAAFVGKLQDISIDSQIIEHIENLNIKNVGSFVNNMCDALEIIKGELKSELHLDSIYGNSCLILTDKTPYDKIFYKYWGCTETCPWCNEPCSKSLNHGKANDSLDKHHCIQHRPQGVGGTAWNDSGKLCVESCHFCVQSTASKACGNWSTTCKSDCSKYHPYKSYSKYMPAWEINPSTGMSSSKYWAWFMYKYKEELAQYYMMKPPAIPASFKMDM